MRGWRNPAPPPREHTMKVKAITNFTYLQGPIPKGFTFDVPQAVARDFIRAKLVVAVPSAPKETASAKPEKETAQRA